MSNPNNPYEILGVTQDASDDEVRQAYKNMLAQYDPQTYEDNPLSHLAEEKREEVKNAYRSIMREREGTHKTGSTFIDIRRMINDNRIYEADELLEGVPFNKRDAEWYFLKGSVQHSRGWLEEAFENFTRAAQMNPQNNEYRAALSQLQWQRQTGNAQNSQNMPTGGQVVQCGACDLCATMCCANMCCNCMR